MCVGGVCVGDNPVICTPLDECHVAGTCDRATGLCSNPDRWFYSLQPLSTTIAEPDESFTAELTSICVGAGAQGVYTARGYLVDVPVDAPQYLVDYYFAGGVSWTRSGIFTTIADGSASFEIDMPSPRDPDNIARMPVKSVRVFLPNGDYVQAPVADTFQVWKVVPVIRFTVVWGLDADGTTAYCGGDWVQTVFTPKLWVFTRNVPPGPWLKFESFEDGYVEENIEVPAPLPTDLFQAVLVPSRPDPYQAFPWCAGGLGQYASYSELTSTISAVGAPYIDNPQIGRAHV